MNKLLKVVSLVLSVAIAFVFISNARTNKLATAAPSEQTAVGTEFTYQGILLESDNPAEGNYDFIFTLYEDSNGTSQISSPITRLDVVVTDGRFFTTLDFGDVFDGSDRWLKIEVRPAGSGSYTELLPLEKITPTPYAVYTEAVEWNNIKNVPAGFADNIDNVDDADASSSNELQNLFQTVNGDSGTTTADSQTDALTIAGAGSVSTAVSGDTITITGNETDPQVVSNTNNAVPRWNGSALDDSQTFINTSGRMMMQIASTAVSDYGEDLNIIGSDSPTIRFRQTDEGAFAAQVWDIGGNEQHFYVREPGSISGTVFPFRIFPDSPTNSLVIDGSAGEVGIGTAGPSFKLEVNGSAGKPGGGSWSDTSDERLKTNVQPLDGEESLSKLLALEPVSFEWINPEGHAEGTQAGFIAQQVETVFPEWVQDVDVPVGDEDLVGSGERVKAISFPHSFNAYLVEALQTQQSQIEALEEENAQLKAVLCELAPNAAICQ